MNEKNNSVSLAKIEFTTYCADDTIASVRPGTELFDGRRDFVMNPAQSGLAVLLTLAAEWSLRSPQAPAVRRTVSVALIDCTAGAVLGTDSVTVEIPAGDFTGVCRVDFPFAGGDVDSDHSYAVAVRDESSRMVLGEAAFRMYDERRCGRHVTDWFVMECGGVADFCGSVYRAIDYPADGYHKVMFAFRTNFEEAPLLMPEMEVRVHYPDGQVDLRFVRPVRDGIDAALWHVEMPFLAGLCRRGVHYAELLCMDYPLAGMVFATDYAYEGGAWDGADLDCLDEYSHDAAVVRFHRAMGIEPRPAVAVADDEELERLLNEFIDSQHDDSEAADEEDFPEMMPVGELTGLHSVKEKLAVYEKLTLFNKLRRDHSLPADTLPLHAMFMGSPGTGKTTVAKMMGQMLARAGVLSRGHVVVRERASLLGPNYSMEEKNTLDAIAEARGGILLIDEAYQLCQPHDPRDPGRFVIEALMTALADESDRDWMLILAGYPDEMKRMFEMNPGLRSRIPDSNIYMFDDFSEVELMEIAERHLERHSYTLTCAAREALWRRLADDCSRRDRSFGNARHVINLIQTEVLPAMAVRVVSAGAVGQEALREIHAADIPAPVRIMQHPRPRIGYCA